MAKTADTQSSPAWVTKLQKLLPAPALSTSLKVRQEHGGDAWHMESLPDVVARPANTKQVSIVMKFANENKIPVTPRGAGRGYVGGCVPVKGGISLSLKKMNKLKEVSVEDSLAVVQPGVITGDLQQAAAEKGLFYPPDPASLKESSICGNIATNAGGPRCLKYGVTRSYVLGLEVVLADGTIVRTGGRTHKNKLGFNVGDVFIGSEGMLGVLTEATVRLIPMPPAAALAIATFPKATQAAKAVTAIQTAGLLPAAIEVADKFTLAAARDYSKGVPPGEAWLLVEVDGQPATVKAELALVSKILKESGALKILKAPNRQKAEELWQMRRDLSYSLKATGLKKLNEDIVVPRGKLLEVFKLGEKLQKKYGDAVACFGHAGDGNIHVNIMIPPEKEDLPETWAALDELFTKVIGMGGTLTGEHGVGLAKKRWWKQAAPEPLRDLHHRVKDALDPNGILNPGKFLDD